MDEHEYKFFLDFNDNRIAKDFLAEHSDLYRICMNPKSENLGFFSYFYRKTAFFSNKIS